MIIIIVKIVRDYQVHLYFSPDTTLMGETAVRAGVVSSKIGLLAVPWPTCFGESATVIGLEEDIHCTCREVSAMAMVMNSKWSSLRTLVIRFSGSFNRILKLSHAQQVTAG